MEFDYEMLRGRIRERFVTEDNFARAMRISDASLRRKLRNDGDFTRGKMIRAAELLDIDALSIPDYFFVEKVQKDELFDGYRRRTAKACSKYVC